MNETKKQLRQKAKECRERAERATTADERLRWLELAEQFELRARETGDS